MANTKSITKVLEYLKTKDDAVSPSEICRDVNLKYRTVIDVISILNQTNQITHLSTGRNTLVKYRGENLAK